MIYDAFTFNDELDLLELRLMETYDLIDRYILLENKKDFRGNPKELHYLKSKSRFDEWNDKIVHLTVDIGASDVPLGVDHGQRRALFNGLDHLDFTDLFLLGDADELVSREALKLIRRTPPDRAYVVPQMLYFYRVTNRGGLWWNGTIVRPRGVGKIDCQAVRDTRNLLPQLPVEVGGWHFSWMGDAADIKKKLSMMDVQADNDFYNSRLPVIPEPTDENVDRIVALGDDLFGRPGVFSAVPIVPGVYQPESIERWLLGKDKYR